jgi:hypothetical protein
MVFERTGPGGRRGVRPIGVGLIADFTIIDTAPAGDQILFSGQFRFAFTLYL